MALADIYAVFLGVLRRADPRANSGEAVDPEPRYAHVRGLCQGESPLPWIRH